MGLWNAGGLRVGRPQCIVGWWRTWGGRTPWDCGMLEGPGWEDPSALWDDGGPGVGGPQCIVGGPGMGGPQSIVG